MRLEEASHLPSTQKKAAHGRQRGRARRRKEQPAAESEEPIRSGKRGRTRRGAISRTTAEGELREGMRSWCMAEGRLVAVVSKRADQREKE